MWTKVRLIVLVVAPFCLGFLFGQSKGSESAAPASQFALERAYADGWREGSRYVSTNYLSRREADEPEAEVSR